MERLVINSDTTVVEAEELPQEFQGATALPASPDADPTLAEAVAAFEREQIERALKKCSGNKRDAANLLGIGYSTLSTKMRALGFAAVSLGDDDVG